VFAVASTTVLGFWQALVGLTALLRDGVYSAAPAYTYTLELTVWGWIHLLVGVLIAGAGIAVLMGKAWGSAAAIVLASLSMVVNFAFIPHFPIYSLAIIALDVAVIWTLTTYERDIASSGVRGTAGSPGPGR
jgi:hypothetical protein